MLPRSISILRVVALLALLTWVPTPSRAAEKAEAKFSPEQVQFFEKEVLPVLKANCFRCHGGENKVRAHLDLTKRGAILQGGDSGPAVLLDKPAMSRLVVAINYKGEPKMPPRGKLSAEHIEILTRWVHAGLPVNEEHAGGEAVVKEGLQITDADRDYWAYRALRRPPLPDVKNRHWLSNPIDAFILARIEAEGLHPAKPTDRIALVRRVYYDLIGLPPTPAEVDAFVNDDRPDAYERLVDRLLASPHYGEKWGRHWLDLVRYAETHGYERDSPKPFAWRYRDYVIRSFNDDKPYDRFVQEQLAGDELDDVTTESLIATGFYRLGIWDDEPADRLLAKYDVFDDIVSTTSQVMLGMTAGCARCHDHKRDPIPQRDYYSLLAYFRDISDMNKTNLRKVMSATSEADYQRALAERNARETKYYQEMYQLEQKLILALAQNNPAADAMRTPLVDLSYRFYRDTWKSLPDFDSLKHETEGSIASGFLSLAPASRKEAIGLVFEGKLQVPMPGEYTFEVEAAEGVRVIVGGDTIVDRPKPGHHRVVGKATLPAGRVPFRLEYFNTYRKPVLSVTWSGADFVKRPLSKRNVSGEAVLPDARTKPSAWRFTSSQPRGEWTKRDYDEEAEWSKGRGGFGRVGTPGSKVMTPWTTSDIWLRKTFKVTQVPPGLALSLHHDEDVEVYLNGTRIYEAKDYLTEYKRIELPKAAELLQKGRNVLAIHCKQTGGGQYIDAGLLASNDIDVAELMQREGAKLLGAEQARRYFTLKGLLDTLSKTVLPKPGVDVMCVQERGKAPTHVLIRGNPHIAGDKVEPRIPEVLARVAPNNTVIQPRSGSSGKRRAFAEWLTDSKNPLTPRVLANRLWQYHFGRGIVPTSNDFGQLGEAPTHPLLLDWLAAELVEGGWQIKRMHKLMMMSNTYRMSSQADKAALELDPSNTLFWRFNMRRLTAEEVRDSALSVSGNLNLKMAGPSIYPEIPNEVLQGQSRPGSGWPVSKPDERVRRSVYVHVKRSLLVPILQKYDSADTDSTCAVRYTTTVPTQALGMLNGDFSARQATAFAERVQAETPGKLDAQVQRIIRLTTGRQPTTKEVADDVAFIRKLQTEEARDEKTALTLYCLLALNTNEFVYLD